MNKQKKAALLTVIIAAFGVAIGFLGELMPADLKSKIELVTTQFFGISYQVIWILIVVCFVFVFLFFVWKDVLNSSSTQESTNGSKRNVFQKGKKSVYIENNKGHINIK